MLRWVRVGEAEAIRAIAFLIRDRNWSTAVPEITDLAIEEKGGGFTVSFSARCPTIDGDFIWRGTFAGTPDGTLQLTGVGSARRGLSTGRTGFVILHPLAGFVGGPVAIEHVDGTVEKSAIPAEIVPDQPYLLVRAMTHSPSRGVKATIRMEGDSWETEDHRNWTDASFKTYCRPLSLPYPYKIPAGEEVRHTVTLSFAGKLPANPAAATGRGLREARPSVRTHAENRPERSAGGCEGRRWRRRARRSRRRSAPQLPHRHAHEAAGRSRSPPMRRLAKATGAEIVLEVIIPGKDKPAP